MRERRAIRITVLQIQTIFVFVGHPAPPPHHTLHPHPPSTTSGAGCVVLIHFEAIEATRLPAITPAPCTRASAGRRPLCFKTSSACARHGCHIHTYLSLTLSTQQRDASVRATRSQSLTSISHLFGLRDRPSCSSLSPGRSFISPRLVHTRLPPAPRRASARSGRATRSHRSASACSGHRRMHTAGSLPLRRASRWPLGGSP